MSRQKAEEALAQARPGKSNAYWFAGRGLSFLTPAVQPRLVAPAMTLLAKRGGLLRHLKKLPKEFDALALEVLQRAKQPESIFVDAWKGDVRSAGQWMHQLDMVHDRRGTERLSKLVTPQAVEAAQATVAATGLAIPKLLAVLARDGSESSADVVLPHALEALKAKDERLDALREWVNPFARGPHFKQLLVELERAAGAREAASPLAEWLASLGLEAQRVRFEANFGAEESLWVFWLSLDSARLPHVDFSLSCYERAYLSVEDFKVKTMQGLSVSPPADLQSLPAWLARFSRRRRIEWRRTPSWITSTLRGSARARVSEWLFAGA